MNSIKRLGVYSFIIAAGALAAFSSANATIYAIDNFSITKNGNPFFNDPFSDGNPPPSSEATLPGGTTTAEYLTVGTPSESNGRVFLDTDLGASGSSPLNGEPVSTQRSRLKTNIEPGSTAGLRADDTFKVSGLFDFILPETTDRYGIRLADWDAPPDGPAGVVDVVEMVVERDIAGDILASFRKYNFVAGTRDSVYQFNISTYLAAIMVDLNDIDQIALELSKQDAMSTEIYGSLILFDYGSFETSVFGLTPTNIFTDYDFTRAEFIAIRVGSVPEPATTLLMGLGLAGLGFSRRRKA